MFKKITILTMLFCVMTAQESRVAAFTPVNASVVDYSNISSFASHLSQHGNLAHLTFASAGDYDTYNFGTNFNFMDDMYIGLYLNKPVVNVFAANPALNPTGLNLNKETEFLFGMKLSDMDVALGLSLAADASLVDNAASKTDNSIRDFGVRAAVTMMNFDAEVRFNSSSALRDFTDKNNDANNFDSDWATTSFNFNGRYIHELSKKMTAVGLVNFTTGSGDLSLNDENNANDDNLDEASLFGMNLLIALNYSLNDDNLFVLAVQPYSSFSIENTQERPNGATEIITDVNTSTLSTLPAYYVGVESRINSWLVGRFGVSQVYSSTLLEVEHKESENSGNNTKTETTSYTNDFKASFGLGMEFGNFKMDYIFNEGILSEGPHFLSGNSNPLSNRLTVTYNF